MNLPYFIAKRIRHEQPGSFSSTINVIAVVTIAVGLGAAILSFLVMLGFQETVKNKVYGFSAHLRLTMFTMNNSVEEQGFFYNIDFYKHPEQFPLVDHVQEYAHKVGLIKTENEVMGVVVKGVGKSFDQTRFSENMVEGRFLTIPDSGYSREVVLSRIIADKINAKVGDDMVIHFFQNPPRFRKLKVVGIYETNLADYYDSKIIMGDIRMVQRLNDWADSVAGGLQVYVRDPEKAELALEQIGENMDYDLAIELTSDVYYQVFEWLALVNRQVYILLGIILTVVCVNMISVVLILVMERTQMVGMLKALGATNGVIQSVFIFNGMQLIGRGLLFGNLLGLGLCLVQHQFRIFKLNPHDYYMSYVPISWNWGVVLALNLAVFLIVTVVMLIPSRLVARINPIRAIRFD